MFSTDQKCELVDGLFALSKPSKKGTEKCCLLPAGKLGIRSRTYLEGNPWLRIVFRGPRSPDWVCAVGGEKEKDRVFPVHSLEICSDLKTIFESGFVWGGGFRLELSLFRVNAEKVTKLSGCKRYI